MEKAESLLQKMVEDQFSMESDLIKEALINVDSNRLRSFHKSLTKEPHIAGRKRDQELTKYIQKAFMDMSFDHVELAEFDFNLSWPNQVLLISSFLQITRKKNPQQNSSRGK